MKSDQEIMQSIRAAIDDCTKGVDNAPSLQYQIARKAKGEEPVVKKISTSVVLVVALIVITTVALATGVIYNQEWYWNHRNSYEKANRPEVYEAIMANMVENPEQIQCEDDDVQIVIQDASWAPEANIMTISFRATPKKPDLDELHSMWALDTDGSYIGEGGSLTVTDDSEDRAVHWLWRSDIEMEDASRGYGNIPGYGPVADMMDDSQKHLLLIEYTGTHVSIDLPDNTVGELPMPGSMDMFRSANGDVYFVGEFDLSSLQEDLSSLLDDYEQKMRDLEKEIPDMKDHYEANALAAREDSNLIGENGITCYLTYRIVEYREGMDDSDLYTSGDGRSVQFIIRPVR